MLVAHGKPDSRRAEGRPHPDRIQGYLGLSGATEFWLAVSLFALGILFKLWNVFFYQFDSDESQHLHVIWAWTHGLVQYRDVFDNHMPLFHLLCAPILALLGESATDLYWMRLLMLPLYFVSAWCLYRIGTIAYSRRIGLWSMLLASGISPYHFCSTEFRTDNLWAALWFLCLLVLISSRFTWRSCMVGGVLFGLCFGISMKTTLMLGTIISAAGIALWLIGRRQLGLEHRQLGFAAAAFAVCMAIVPLVIITAFAAKGLWPEFRYCVFAHNLEPPTRNTYLNPLLLLVGLPILILAARKLIRHQANATLAFRRAFLFLTCGIYFVLLRGVWRHVTREDYLPFFPLLALTCVALLFMLSKRIPAHTLRSRFVKKVPLAGVAATLAMLLDLAPRLPFTDEAGEEADLVRDVLTLTNSGEAVFDCKGETIFRQRSYHYVLETITDGRIERGEIPHPFANVSPETLARVAVVTETIPTEDANVLETNYLPLRNGLMVAGLRLNHVARGTAAHFHIAMPDRYVILARDSPVSGILDGSVCNGSRFLGAGDHTFVPAESYSTLTLLWAQAAQRHFIPISDGGPLRLSSKPPMPLLRPVTLFRDRFPPNRFSQ